MIPTGAGEAIGKAAAPDGNSVGPNGIITPGPPHEGSRVTPDGRIISVPPDVCLTPRGSAMVPVPYKIWAYQKEATNLANTVLQTTLRSHVKGSIIRECYGDEAGTGGGIRSGTHNAECTPKTWSKTVLWESRNAVRDSDEWWMNNKNTWGVLDYKKDVNQYDTQASSQVDARMWLAFVDTEHEHGVGLAEPEEEEGSPGGAGGVTLGGEDFINHKAAQFRRNMENSMLRAIIEEKERLDAQEAQKNAVRQTGQKCPCIVGTYKSVKSQCSDAKCGGQAHHIVADKYLRLGTRPAPGALDPNRIKGMPSLNDGPSICLNGNAGDEDTDHNIAHQNDGLIQSLGDAHNPQGTLPIGQIQALSVAAAKEAAPSDPACQAKIDEWTGINKYGGDSNALVRSSNNPPAAGSPAMNYFRPPQPIQR